MVENFKQLISCDVTKLKKAVKFCVPTFTGPITIIKHIKFLFLLEKANCRFQMIHFRYLRVTYNYLLY